MLDLVAGTNPSRPVLNIPELVEDIVDLPKAIRNLGDILMNPKKATKANRFAGEYLGVQFGWLPVIEDLHKLINFQKYAIKRAEELTKLYSGKGLRRRLKFSDDTAMADFSVQTATYANAIVTLNCSVLVKRKSWATIHWKPTAPPPYHPGDLGLNSLAERLVLGATPEAMINGIWKVIPWTWLIGWFTNFGKYTLANSWTVPATHTGGSFMSQADAYVFPRSISAAGSNETKLSHAGVAIRTLKTRIVSTSVVAGVNMPMLDMFRLSILSALFVQRFVGRK